MTTFSNKVALNVLEIKNLSVLTDSLIVLKNRPVSLPILTTTADASNMKCQFDDKAASICQKDGKILCSTDSGIFKSTSVTASINNQTVKTVTVDTLDFTIVDY